MNKKCFSIFAVMAVFLLTSCGSDTANNEKVYPNGYNVQQEKNTCNYELYPMYGVDYNTLSPNLYGGRSAAEIRYDLNRAYELLNELQEDMDNSTGVIRSSYPQMISEQRLVIYRLENELMNATH